MSDEMNIEIASRVRVLRAAKGLTHRELGEATGMSAATIAHIEKGRQRPLAAQVAALALALGVPVADLFPAVVSRKAG